MKIWEIKGKKVFAGPGTWSYVAEAKVVDEEDRERYVTVQEYDGSTEYTVSEKSVYDFLAGGDEEPVEELEEEYSKYADTAESKYRKVYELLLKVIAGMKKEF